LSLITSGTSFLFSFRLELFASRPLPGLEELFLKIGEEEEEEEEEIDVDDLSP